MKLVMVEWEDSCSRRGWQPLDEMTQRPTPLMCRSVGWLASETKRCAVLVPHLSGENDNVRVFGCGELTIPKSAIRRMKVLASS